ncbi:ABC transporter substrate-binding protein [Candidatus Parabeggiatoa sp. HSG14]|uniref:MlaC/ttg2D family ABC transporter substrate-binding protein n=1 Tax=Candidatus Parabeggiatoa sp. HSG14 TaxID=3055593 RepID=UPI0025A897BC|nr:ABC transporter substrate-binding protein [Thiotrichales bacterium HSG14]
MKQLLANMTLISVLMLSTLHVWAATNAQDAETLIATTTTKVLEALKKNPNQIRGLVENEVLPHFDLNTMSTRMLGKHWRRANKNQKTRFVEGLRYLLISFYSFPPIKVALVDQIDYSSKALGMMGKKKPKPTALVSAKIYQKGKSTPIEVDYFMYFKSKSEKWKVYNLSVGGMNLVNSYRIAFKTISKIDDFIKLMSHIVLPN